VPDRQQDGILISARTHPYKNRHSDKTGERIFHALTGLALTCIGQATLAVALARGSGAIWLTVGSLTIAKMGGQGFMTPMRGEAKRTCACTESCATC